MTGTVTATVAELVQRQWGDPRTGLRSRDTVLTHHDVSAGAAARAALLVDLLPRGAEPHLGVLLDNTPEYPLWLSAAALAGAAVAGINPTRRGAELARDIVHTECRVLVTQRAYLPLLDGLALPGLRVLVTDTDAYTELLTPYEGAEPGDAVVRPVRPDSRMLLYFTSGSTGAPKAAICSQGRLAAAGASLVAHFGVGRDDVHYICMPMFHGNAVIADWAPALSAGASVALRDRFSASGFLPDVREFGATYFTYVGRAIQYLLATPEGPGDREHGLRLGFGTEAGAVDAARFEARFGVKLVEGYGSSEGGAAIQRTPDTPTGAIGRAAPGDGLAVVDAEGQECERARFSPQGHLLNGAAAIGELVNKGRSPFEGYWRNEEAEKERLRGGWYWTGDLFYRDEADFYYFAGRTDDRLRVDSENLAAAVIENILARWTDAEAVAVYAVPDPVAGDMVMAALALREGAAFDPARFTEFLSGQADLGTKMPPRFVRVMDRLPTTATNKIQRASLRTEGFLSRDELWWRPTPGAAYTPLTPKALTTLRATYDSHNRAHLVWS
ncbi:MULTISPECIES: AMP-binding protein [Streptomyces]|uniref:AMP-binding protein n=1 Tax=Streptomyces solicathayae TaxID=3081768 RepID=A0ABZ0LXX5_9ACTN|nr:AMP-binding protein [Streptomyces sp. HUAS YS2]WOX24180.1 AMP-binding protein [Streptomyces sp. HUAS YS2]